MVVICRNVFWTNSTMTVAVVTHIVSANNKSNLNNC